eukprot:376674-Alexandrium_andersonii.AAC.1
MAAIRGAELLARRRDRRRTAQHVQSSDDSASGGPDSDSGGDGDADSSSDHDSDGPPDCALPQAPCASPPHSAPP